MPQPLRLNLHHALIWVYVRASLIKVAKHIPQHLDVARDLKCCPGLNLAQCLGVARAVWSFEAKFTLSESIIAPVSIMFKGTLSKILLHINHLENAFESVLRLG